MSRFSEPQDPLFQAINSSVGFDYRLAPFDLDQSLAHARMLARVGILDEGELADIERGLADVRIEIEQNRFEIRPDDEDIHMAIERRLTELVGPVGGKLHTARSRNDQVATDLRLYLRDAVRELSDSLRRYQQSLLALAQAHRDVVMPGYTHLQHAQPVLLAHHLLAYVEMAERDKGRLAGALSRINVLPLGSGALAGTN